MSGELNRYQQLMDEQIAATAFENFSLIVLDLNFVSNHIISQFNAFIWNVGYWEAGDFQLEVPWNAQNYRNLKVGYYLYLRGQKEIMVIETIGLTYDAADRSKRKIVVKGRTLSSLLERRIVWGNWSASNTNVQSFILNEVNRALGTAAWSDRSVSYFRTRVNPELTSGPSFTGHGYGDNLYELVQAICETYSLGFRAVYEEDEDLVYFELYRGIDRSYSQGVRPPVIFSSSFENLGPTRYALDTKDYKTIALATGSEETYTSDNDTPDDPDDDYEIKDKTVMTVGATQITGLNRREIYVSASETEPDAIANAAMEQLAKVNTLETLDAELDAGRQFIFDRDFMIGDVVQVMTDFGLDAKARVIGFIMSWGTDGYQEVPTFKILED